MSSALIQFSTWSCLPSHDVQSFILAAASNGESRTSNVKRPRRILVVDDEQTIADSLVEILKANNFEALAFYTGESAIAAARKQCPDVVLSDVVMPRLNGVETVLEIRKLCPTARIVLFSGQAGTTTLLQKARDQGHEFDLLPKPLHPDELLKHLRRSF